MSLLPSFAANWLVPRLRNFNETHPDIELVLYPTLRLTISRPMRQGNVLAEHYYHENNAVAESL